LYSLALAAPAGASIGLDPREKFLSLYPRRDSYIWKTPADENWRTTHSLLRDHQIMGVISDAGRGLFRGCYFGDRTQFAVLDIDQGSKYHNPAELAELAGKLSSVGLTITPYQSSDSGGWHLYLFFDDRADSAEVSQTLRTWLKLEGYEIKGGTLEVFPSGCALRLPLQPGFAWLDSQGIVIRRREEIDETEALASFLIDLESNACSWTKAKSRLDSQISARRGAGAGSAQEHQKAIDLEGFEALWSDGRNQERIEEARYYLDHGLTEKGQRHDAIYAIEHLLWYGDPDRRIPKLPGSHNDRRREQFLKDWLTRNHNGYCRHVNSNNWRLLEGHIRRACEWRPADHQETFEKIPYAITDRSTDAMVGLTKTTGHLWRPEDLERANQKRERAARAKIREATERLRADGRRVTGRAIMRLTGCSYHTVKRHVDIWKISPAVSLPRAAGDLDPGGGGELAVVDQPGSDPLPEKKNLNLLLVDETQDLSSSPTSSDDSSSLLRRGHRPPPLPTAAPPPQEFPGVENDLDPSGLERTAEVAPLSSSLAEEPTTRPQCQNQDLEAGLIVLTPGPRQRGIQFGTAGCKGGIVLCFPARSVDGAAESSGVVLGGAGSPGQLLTLRADPSGVYLSAEASVSGLGLGSLPSGSDMVLPFRSREEQRRLKVLPLPLLVNSNFSCWPGECWTDGGIGPSSEADRRESGEFGLSPRSSNGTKSSAKPQSAVGDVCLSASGVCYFADVQRRIRDVFLPDRRRGEQRWSRGPP